MSREENVAVVNRYLEEIWNKGNLDAVDDLLSEDYRHGTPPPGMEPTREGFKQYVGMVKSAFPDLTLRAEDTIAEGDKVVQRNVGRGTHRGDFVDVPPTGKEVNIDGISIYQVRDGRIVKDWTIVDLMGLMQQIGAIPAPDKAG
jgi:steroid delta-isomerase-like uncharacterized protein